MTPAEIKESIKILQEVINQNKGSREVEAFLVIADARNKIRQLIKLIKP